jgi:hypothetical protein
MIAKHCCVTSLRMCKLHVHKENTAAVLLAVCAAGVVWQWIYISQYELMLLSIRLAIMRNNNVSLMIVCININTRSKRSSEWSEGFINFLGGCFLQYNKPDKEYICIYSYIAWVHSSMYRLDSQ